MLILSIQMQDDIKPISITMESTTSTDFAELKGVVHLGNTPTKATSSQLFVLAVPGNSSWEDFLLFCGSYILKFNDVIFVINDVAEDRYSVLIKFENQVSAEEFYDKLNGERFKPGRVEVCHLYFVGSVYYTWSGKPAIAPSEWSFPTCPVCVERLDFNTSRIQSKECDQCQCPLKWPYSSCIVCQLCKKQDPNRFCNSCGTSGKMWTCLICGFIGCGRNQNGHAMEHCEREKHRFSLEVESQNMWDYLGSRYVHSKVGTSVMANSHGISAGERGTCLCVGGEELDALSITKLNKIVDDCNRNLVSLLEVQRNHYKSCLNGAIDGGNSSMKNAIKKAKRGLKEKLKCCKEEKEEIENLNILLPCTQQLQAEYELLTKDHEMRFERDRRLK